VYCPEDGGPYLEKPLVFGTPDAWRRAAPRDGFVLTREHGHDVLRGRLSGGEYTLTRAPGSAMATFESDGARLTLDWTSHEVRAAILTAPAEAGTHVSHDTTLGSSPNPESRTPNPVRVDLAHYLTLRTLMDALLRPSRIHFVNAPLLEP